MLPVFWLLGLGGGKQGEKARDLGGAQPTPVTSPAAPPARAGVGPKHGKNESGLNLY